MIVNSEFIQSKVISNVNGDDEFVVTAMPPSLANYNNYNTINPVHIMNE